MAVSFSVELAMTANDSGSIFAAMEAGDNCQLEKTVVAALAVNAVCDRPTGNGVDWANVRLEVSARRVAYVTRGGFGFGWDCIPGDLSGEEVWRFYVERPADRAGRMSALFQSAEKYGWVAVPK